MIQVWMETHWWNRGFNNRWLSTRSLTRLFQAYLLTSNSRETCSGMAILSPLMSVSTLLSSITEFILSIHKVSTGPSNVIHFSSGFSSIRVKKNHNYRQQGPKMACSILQVKLAVEFLNTYYWPFLIYRCIYLNSSCFAIIHFILSWQHGFYSNTTNVTQSNCCAFMHAVIRNKHN